MTNKLLNCKAMPDLYIVVEWPEIQEFMDKPGFEDNCFLINDERGYAKFGDSSYFCNYAWLSNL